MKVPQYIIDALNALAAFCESFMRITVSKPQPREESPAFTCVSDHPP
jgi:hypothetical protein